MIRFYDSLLYQQSKLEFKQDGIICTFWTDFSDKTGIIKIKLVILQ